MKSYTIYVCEPNESMRENLKAFFKDKPEISLVTCENAEKVKGFIQNNIPDAVLLDLEFDNAIKLCEDIKNAQIKLILTGRISDEEERSREIKSDAFLFKPYSLFELRAEILNIVTANPKKLKVAGSKNIDEKLSNIFIRVGIPPHIKGYQYLRVAVKLAVNDPDMVNKMTKKLYPTVAEYFNSSPSKVERAIRHAIEVAWSKGKIENINTIFGIKIYGKEDKPTNGELIALVADKVSIDMMA